MSDVLRTLASRIQDAPLSTTSSRPARDKMSDYPHIFPPPGFEPFDLAGYVAFPAVGVSAVVVQIPVRAGWDGVIKRLSANLSGPALQQGSGDVVWKILRNTAAVKGYHNIRTELGTPQTPRDTDGILIFSGDLVQMVVTNAALAVAGAYVTGSFGGYFWPRG